MRPLSVKGQLLGLAVVLQGPRVPPGGLALKGIPSDPQPEPTLTPAEAGRIEPLDGEPDVLKAFLNTLD